MPLLISAVFTSGALLYGGGPHKAYGRLVYENGSAPGSVTFSAYILARPGEVLDQGDFDCGYENGTWYVQCGNFASTWNLWDVLHVDFSDGAGKSGHIEVVLTADAADNAGRTVLTAEDYAVTLGTSNVSGQRGTTVQVPVTLSGLGAADSVIAYSLTLTFDPDVLVAVGGSSSSTLTQNWGAPYTSPKSEEITIGGFTANNPAGRMTTVGNTLVKAEFIIQGIPSSQTSSSTLIRVHSGVIYTLSKTYIISRTRTGALRVLTDGTQVTRNVTLKPFWNLLSLGIAPTPNTVPEVLNGLAVSYIYGFIAGEGPKSWDVNRPSFLNDLLVLDGMHGYWFKSTAAADQQWSVPGVLIGVATPLVLYQGWNLVSYLPQTADLLSHALGSLASKYTYVIGYNGSTTEDWDINRPDFLNTLTHLRPMSGYWVKMGSAGQLTYPTSGYSPPKPVVFAGDSSGVRGGLSTTNCDFWGVQPDLFSQYDTIRAYDPDNVLCGDTLVGPEGGFLLHVMGDDFTTPEEDEGAVEGDTIRFTINSRPARVISGNPVWNDLASKEITLAYVETGVSDPSGGQPGQFMLHQNYPNPFNGRTVIGFTLAAPSEVTVVIFDSMGREVKRLLDHESLGAGPQQTAWDGTDARGMKAPSDIYFCRLVTGTKSLVKKMILLN